LRRTVLASLVAAALAVVAPLSGAQSEGPLVVESAWIRKPPPGLDSAALYFTVKNSWKDRDVFIVGAASARAANAMIHESSTVDGQSRMRMKDTVKIPAGKSVTFAPEGLHVMLTGLTKPLEVGEPVPVTLELDHGGSVDFMARVRPLDAK
jgi:copper(I)-binding protein